MGDLVDLAEYRNKKQEDEIARLRAELQEIVESIGGLDVVPTMIMYDVPYPPVVYTQSIPNGYDTTFSIPYTAPEKNSLSVEEDE